MLSQDDLTKSFD